MDQIALNKLTYGLYILTAKDGDNDNGCIIDTAMQVTNDPNQLCVCVNKSNYTHDMIAKTGKFTISVLNQNADLEIIKRFGYQTGKDTDKFYEFTGCKRGKNDIYYIIKDTNAYISVIVNKAVDLGTHTMYIGEITDMEILTDIPSITYEYYLNMIKK